MVKIERVITRKVCGFTPHTFLIKCIIALLAIMSLLLSGCENSATFKNNHHEAGVVDATNDVEINELPEGLIYHCPTKNGFIVEKLSEKTITNMLYLLDIDTQEMQELFTPNWNEGVFHTVVANSEWIGWVEYLNYEPVEGALPYKWQILARNMKTGEQILIDESNFSNEQPDLETSIGYTPKEMAISDQNIIVYSKPFLKDEAIACELSTYSLDDNIKEIVISTDNVMDTVICGCTIYGDNIVYSYYTEINYDLKFRMSGYKYGDLYLYKISTGEIKQLTSNDYYYAPNLYRNMLVMMKIPLSVPNQQTSLLEIAMMDIETLNIKTVADQYSSIFQGGLEDTLKDIPRINNRYISWWYDPLDEVYVYDYLDNQFVAIYKNGNTDWGKSNFVSGMFGNFVLLYDRVKEADLCIRLPEN